MSPSLHCFQHVVNHVYVYAARAANQKKWEYLGCGLFRHSGPWVLDASIGMMAVSPDRPPSCYPLDYEPLGRFQHSGAVTSDGKFYTYGGRFGHSKAATCSPYHKGRMDNRVTNSSVVRTTINRFDSTTERWHLLPTSGSPPPGRVGVACTIIGSKLYAFGGRSRNKLFNTPSVSLI